jgi:hypothetical protein
MVLVLGTEYADTKYRFAKLSGGIMKKVLSTLVAALVALSFSAVVFAAETVKTDVKSETTTTSPSGEVKVEKKEVKKVKKTKKAKKVKKEEAPKTDAAAPAAK